MMMTDFGCSRSVVCSTFGLAAVEIQRERKVFRSSWKCKRKRTGIQHGCSYTFLGAVTRISFHIQGKAKGLPALLTA